MIIFIEQFRNASQIKTEDFYKENEDDENDDQTKYHQLKRESEEKDEQINNLEKKYLELIAKLLPFSHFLFLIVNIFKHLGLNKKQFI